MGLSNYPHNKPMRSGTLLLAPLAECAADARRYVIKWVKNGIN